MKTDKSTVNFMLIIIGATLLLTILFFLVKSYSAIWQLLFELFIGIFCSAIVALLVSIVAVRSKFFTLLNKILFICKQVILNFNKTYYVENDRLLKIAYELDENFKDFYQLYQEMVFLCIINRRFQKPINKLFLSISTLISPFLSIKLQDDIKPISHLEIEHLRSEIIAIRLMFHEFVYSYIDLYTFYDKELLSLFLEWDDESSNPFDRNSINKKHESIKEIISSRKLQNG